MYLVEVMCLLCPTLSSQSTLSSTLCPTQSSQNTPVFNYRQIMEPTHSRQSLDILVSIIHWQSNVIVLNIICHLKLFSMATIQFNIKHSQYSFIHHYYSWWSKCRNIFFFFFPFLELEYAVYNTGTSCNEQLIVQILQIGYRESYKYYKFDLE